jgi:hypothetical protein
LGKKRVFLLYTIYEVLTPQSNLNFESFRNPIRPLSHNEPLEAYKTQKVLENYVLSDSRTHPCHVMFETGECLAGHRRALELADGAVQTSAPFLGKEFGPRIFRTL